MNTKSKNARAELLTGNTKKLFLRFLFPSVTATVMVAMNYFIDALCVGNMLGQSAIAMLTIAQPIPGILYGLGYLLGVGGATLFSAYLGKGDEKKAHAVYTTCLSALAAIVVAIGISGIIFLDPITTFLGGVGNLRDGVREYLLFTFILAPFFGIETFLVTFVRNDNAPRISMAATLCGCSLNIILDVLFLVVFGWGIWSAALATSLAVTLSTVILFFSTFRKKSVMKLVRRGFSFGELFSSVRLGVPSFLSEITASLVIVAFNNVLLMISGETAVEVYGVISSLSFVVINALVGVANAMHPLVSVSAGAGRQARVRGFLKMALLSSLGLVAFFILLGTVWPQWLIRMFVDPSDAFMAMAIPAVRIVFISYLFVAINLLLGVYFQSVQAPGEALILTLMRGVLFPVATVMGFAMFMGVTGVWVSTVAAEVLAVLLALWLFGGVQRRLRENNYARLQYFGRRKAQENIDGILYELGADDLTGFAEMMDRCNKKDERNQSIPAFICLDDLTSDYEGSYTPAQDDEDMGLMLAVGALLFADMYEQDDSYISEKKLDERYPAAAPAMSALASQCFRFIYDEETEDTELVPYLGYGESEERPSSALPGYEIKNAKEEASDEEL